MPTALQTYLSDLDIVAHDTTRPSKERVEAAHKMIPFAKLKLEPAYSLLRTISADGSLGNILPGMAMLHHDPMASDLIHWFQAISKQVDIHTTIETPSEAIAKEAAQQASQIHQIPTAVARSVDKPLFYVVTRGKTRYFPPTMVVAYFEDGEPADYEETTRHQNQ